MVISKNEEFQKGISTKKWVCTSGLAIIVLVIPISCLFYNPILFFAKQYLRLANGTMLHNLMLSRFEGPRIYISLFNITNAEEFMSGKDEKLKLKEVGPFVYQEYRFNSELVINPETNLMTFSPILWTEFIPEESVADPKKIYVTMPSMSMLNGANMMSKYSFILRNVFNVLAASLRSKAIVNITVHEYLWGYPEPLIKLAKTAVPGLFYYNSSGLLERLYDSGARYALEIGTKDEEKFSVKTVRKYREEHTKSDDLDSIQTFSNAYEGAAFPPGLTPSTPIYIYRHSVCKIFRVQHVGSIKTQYGSEAFVYNFANETMNDHQLCDSKGWCPDGILNLAPCYYNFPIALSRGHFLDADPRLLDRFEGIKPDRKLHSTEIIVDPNIGVTLNFSVSIQFNIVLGDVGYNSETRRFKDAVLPLCHTKLKHPKLPPQALTALVVMYVYGPYLLLAVTIICTLLGAGLLLYSIRMAYVVWTTSRQVVLETSTKKTGTYGYLPVLTTPDT